MNDLTKLLKHIRIDLSAVERCAEEWKDLELARPDWRVPALPDFSDRVAEFQFLTVVNSLNFCFIAVDHRPRWRRLDGEYGAFGFFRSLGQAWSRWTDEDSRLIPDKLAAVTEEELALVFSGDPACGPMPLLPERVVILREFARGCAEFPWDKTNWTRREMLAELNRCFPSYRDELVVDDTTIEVAKRGQLLLSMLSGRGLIELADPENVDLFADYRVPQVLRELGILVYPEELLALLHSGALLEEGHPFEREIRLVTLAAGPLLKQALADRGRIVDCLALDFHLWILTRSPRQMLPFHRTYSTKY